MIDLYCNSGKCPICSGEMTLRYKTAYSTSIGCKNNCYVHVSFGSLNENYDNFIVFGKTYTIFDSDKGGLLVKQVQIIEREILSWKENDKYLAEILERS